MYPKSSSRIIGVATPHGSGGTNTSRSVFDQCLEKDIAFLFKGRKPEINEGKVKPTPEALAVD